MTTAERYRLLVIEDDPEMQYLLGAVLAGDDREVVCVDSGEEARRAIAVGKVDLVVLDLLLPDVDGRSLLSSLRDRPETGAVPVVVVTARSGPEIRQDCYALGADAFVEKPFDPDSLVADVAARLRRADSGQGAALVDARTGLPNKAGLR
ncbi:MAG TPA: response regulator, partial [Longimicrobiales bacterium]|nr:response regulator [Longimicrobiales bacterium]